MPPGPSPTPPSSAPTPRPSPSSSDPLFERRKLLIQTSWNEISERLTSGDADSFYRRLFRRYPEVRPLFERGDGGDFDGNEQAEKFFETIGSAVDYLGDAEGLRPKLEELGRKHAAAWNVKRDQYDAVGECLIWTLKTGLKEAWTKDVADAWVWAYQIIAKTMSDAGEERAEAQVKRKVSFGGDAKVESTSNGEGPKEESIASPAAAAAEPQPSLRSLIRAGVTDRNDIPLRPRSAALLVVDIQKELSTIDLFSPHIEYVKVVFPRMISNVARLLRAMRKNRSKMGPGATGSECVFTYCEALTDDSRDVSLDYKLSGQFLANLPGPSRPAQFVPGVEPVRGKDVCLPKTSCSVFQSTNVDYVLRNLGVEQLVVCGQLTDQCVESAVRDAADRGYLVTVAEDACAAQSEGDHEKGLHGMRGFSRRLSTDEVVRELSGG